MWLLFLLILKKSSRKCERGLRESGAGVEKFLEWSGGKNSFLSSIIPQNYALVI